MEIKRTKKSHLVGQPSGRLCGLIIAVRGAFCVALVVFIGWKFGYRPSSLCRIRSPTSWVVLERTVAFSWGFKSLCTCVLCSCGWRPFTEGFSGSPGGLIGSLEVSFCSWQLSTRNSFCSPEVLVESLGGPCSCWR
jgi:hypothetical protein